MKRAVIILSAPEMFGFMRGQPRRLRALGYQPVVLAAASAALDQRAAEEGATRAEVDIRREISPLKDACALLRLAWTLRKLEPEAVLLSGPKAIFLGGMAAWLVGVPTRLVVYHGMRQENARGLLRLVLDACDRVSFASATSVLAVSPSLRQLAIDRQLVPAAKITVTGPGTANGIDADYFARSASVEARSRALRRELRLDSQAATVGYVGRLTEDKGLADLYHAFEILRVRKPGARLVLVGADEMRTAAGRLLLGRMRTDPGVSLIGPVDDVRPYLDMLDVLALPSHREGFGMVVLEAAALGVPSVAYDVTGCRDAIMDGRTGRLVRFGDIPAFAQAIREYLDCPALRQSHGSAARHRAESDYSPDRVWRAYASALIEPA